MADTEANGIIDFEEKLEQAGVYNDFWDDTLIKEMRLSAIIFDDIYDVTFP